MGECRSSGERKYYLANLAPRTTLRALAAAIKARWVCEQAHQQLKGELGLGHFEGRSWTGLHRHALMCCIAYAFLQHLRLAGQSPTRSGKNEPPQARTSTPAKPTCSAPSRNRQAVGSPHATRSLPLLSAPIPTTRFKSAQVVLAHRLSPLDFSTHRALFFEDDLTAIGEHSSVWASNQKLRRAVHAPGYSRPGSRVLSRDPNVAPLPPWSSKEGHRALNRQQLWPPSRQ